MDGPSTERQKAEFGARRVPSVTRVSRGDLVVREYLPNTDRFPLVLRVSCRDFDSVGWFEANRDQIERDLLDHGAILCRGFRVDTAEQFERCARAVYGELCDYVERAAARKRVRSQIFTSTEFNPPEPIPLH